jgi:hypothetical protein
VRPGETLDDILAMAAIDDEAGDDDRDADQSGAPL